MSTIVTFQIIHRQEMNAASGYAQIPGGVWTTGESTPSWDEGLDVMTWTAVIRENTEKQAKRLHTGFSTRVDNLLKSIKSNIYTYIPTENSNNR